MGAWERRRAVLAPGRDPLSGSGLGASEGWYHTYGMKKTTVYLTEDEAEALRRMSALTGRTQAELLREGLHRVVDEAPARVFYSMGKGHSGGKQPRRWSSDEVYERVMGHKS